MDGTHPTLTLAPHFVPWLRPSPSLGIPLYVGSRTPTTSDLNRLLTATHYLNPMLYPHRPGTRLSTPDLGHPPFLLEPDRGGSVGQEERRQPHPWGLPVALVVVKDVGGLGRP